MDERESQTNEELIAQVRNRLENEIVYMHNEETESTQENMIENTPENIEVSNVPSSHDVTETIIKVLHMTNDDNANKIVGAMRKCTLKREIKEELVMLKKSTHYKDIGLVQNLKKYMKTMLKWQ